MTSPPLNLTAAQAPPTSVVDVGLVAQEFRQSLSPLAIALLFFFPWFHFWQDGAGRAFAFASLFLGLALVAAERFRMGATSAQGSRDVHGLLRIWNARMVALGLAGLAASAVFVAGSGAISGRFDLGPVELALLTSAAALCGGAFFMTVVGEVYAAVLFAAAAFGALKLVGCVVVRFVYGPTALADGQMSLSWQQPNLLVWLWLAMGSVLAVVCLAACRRRFASGCTAALPLEGPTQG